MEPADAMVVDSGPLSTSHAAPPPTSAAPTSSTRVATCALAGKARQIPPSPDTSSFAVEVPHITHKRSTQELDDDPITADMSELPTVQIQQPSPPKQPRPAQCPRLETTPDGEESVEEVNVEEVNVVGVNNQEYKNGLEAYGTVRGPFLYIDVC